MEGRGSEDGRGRREVHSTDGTRLSAERGIPAQVASSYTSEVTPDHGMLSVCRDCCLTKRR